MKPSASSNVTDASWMRSPRRCSCRKHWTSQGSAAPRAFSQLLGPSRCHCAPPPSRPRRVLDEPYHARQQAQRKGQQEERDQSDTHHVEQAERCASRYRIYLRGMP
jgi:hypothetical protein